MSKVVRIAAVRRLAARRARRSFQAEARSLIEAHGQHVGYALALAARLVKLSDDERQKLASLSDAMEREVGFGGICPRMPSALRGRHERWCPAHARLNWSDTSNNALLLKSGSLVISRPNHLGRTKA